MSNQKRMTAMERAAAEAKSSEGSYTLRPGIRNYFMAVFAWLAVFVLFNWIGWYNIKVDDTFHTVVNTITCALPLLGMLFIYILEDK